MTEIKRGEPVIYQPSDQFGHFRGVAGAYLPGDMREVMVDINGAITRMVATAAEIRRPAHADQFGVIPQGCPAWVSDWADHEHQGKQIGIFGRLGGTYIAALRSPVQYNEVEDGTQYEPESFPISYDDIEIDQHERAEFSLWEKLTQRPNLPAKTKSAVLRRAGNKCECCKRPGLWPSTLAIHHRTYARWGFEEPQDLLVLCSDCHRGKHADGDDWWNDPEQRDAVHGETCEMIEHAMDREQRHDDLQLSRDADLGAAKAAKEGGFSND